MEQQIPTSSEIRERLTAIGHAETQDLSRASGVPFTTLWKIRSGETSNPRIDTARRFFHLIPVKADGQPTADATPTPDAEIAEAAQAGLIECRTEDRAMLVAMKGQGA